MPNLKKIAAPPPITQWYVAFSCSYGCPDKDLSH